MRQNETHHSFWVEGVSSVDIEYVIMAMHLTPRNE